MFLNNQTSLQHPVNYYGDVLNIEGEMTRHHFHKSDKSLVIEFELDTTPWSSVFVKFDNKTLKMLIPLVEQTPHYGPTWDNIGSRVWRISREVQFYSVYTEDQIAAMLWRKMHRV